jgi:osmoprotectant transport system substrate-binding protein
MPPVRRVLLAALLAVLLAGCASGPQAPDTSTNAVRVASYDFPENQVLAEVYALALRRAGVPVAVELGVGTREVVEPALEQGVVDAVVDYLGTAVDFVQPEGSSGGRSPDDLHRALVATLGARGVTALNPSPAQDQNGFAVSRAFAAAHRVSRLSDLAPLAHDLTLGAPPECPTRPLCLPGLQRVYGLNFGKVEAMSSRAATVEALLAGQIDVGLLETTDARLATTPVKLLTDDRALQPHENVVPLVRSEVLDRFGHRVATALDGVSARLTTAALIRLNRAVEVDGQTPAQAAARWEGGG